jgi:hypothetical protein
MPFTSKYRTRRRGISCVYLRGTCLNSSLFRARLPITVLAMAPFSTPPPKLSPSAQDLGSWTDVVCPWGQRSGCPIHDGLIVMSGYRA